MKRVGQSEFALSAAVRATPAKNKDQERVPNPVQLIVYVL